MERVAYLTGLGAAVAILILGGLGAGASLLPGMLLFSAIVPGAIALVAAGELTRAIWIRPLRPVLLGLHPLLLVLPVAFAALALRLSVYPWMQHPTRWLTAGHFVGRNLTALLLAAGLGILYARAARRESPHAKVLATLYLLGYVLGQSLAAFDWVMSFSYPWVSTLFGGYFLVESLYAGIALSAVLAVVLLRRIGPEVTESLRSAATLLFGFALVWAGQFFSQYLVIWYGNLPEEVAYLVKRLAHSPLRELSTAVLLALFVLPFAGLLSREAKTQPAIVTAAALLVGAGIVIERLVFLVPEVRMALVPALAGVLVLGVPVVMTLRAGLRRG